MLPSLGAAPAETHILLSGSFRLTQGLALAAALLALALLPWRGPAADRQGPPSAALVLGVMALALLAPFLGLLDAWMAAPRVNSVSMTSLHMLGSMQASDSFGYLHGALELLGNGVLNDWNSRRPLTGTLMTLRLMAGAPEMSAIMALGALLVGAGLALAAREVLLAAGGWAALAFICAAAAFASEWTPTTLSEGPGLAMGLFGLAALLAAARRDSLPLFGLGMLVLSIGLMARAGPFFVGPLVLVAGTLWQWRGGLREGWRASWRRMGLWFAVGAAGMAAGFAHSAYLVKTLGGAAGMIQSNFSYTLYGLAVGGKGWQQILLDRPDLFTGGYGKAPEPEIYRLAFEAIAREPMRLVNALLSELSATPGFFFGYFDLSLLNVLLMAGLIAAALAFAGRASLLVIAACLGLVASSPLILSDGGVRVYAAAVPLMALSVALGFEMLRRLSHGLAAGAGPGACGPACRRSGGLPPARRPPRAHPGWIRPRSGPEPSWR